MCEKLEDFIPFGCWVMLSESEKEEEEEEEEDEEFKKWFYLTPFPLR